MAPREKRLACQCRVSPRRTWCPATDHWSEMWFGCSGPMEQCPCRRMFAGACRKPACTACPRNKEAWSRKLGAWSQRADVRHLSCDPPSARRLRFSANCQLTSVHWLLASEICPLPPVYSLPQATSPLFTFYPRLVTAAPPLATRHPLPRLRRSSLSLLVCPRLRLTLSRRLGS